MKSASALLLLLAVASGAAAQSLTSEGGKLEAAWAVRSQIVPKVDHHQHLFSPAAAALVNGPPVLPPITLPPDLAAILRDREAAWNAPQGLQRLYAPNAVLLGNRPGGWVVGSTEIGSYLSKLFARPYRLVPAVYTATGMSAHISGYLAKSQAPAGEYFGYFSLELSKAGGGQWKITSEAPVFPFHAIQEPILASKLVAMLDAAGIKRAVALSEAFWFDGPFITVSDPQAAVQRENDWTADQVAQFPDRLVAFCSFNPLQDYALDELSRCAASHRFAGLKLSFAMSGVDLKKPDHVTKVRRVFEAANRYRMPIVVHARGTDSYGAEDVGIFLNQIVSAAPGVPIQVAHLWGGEAYSDAALAAYAQAVAAHHPSTRNLYFDVAEVARTANGSEEILRTVAKRIRQIGLKRILYGSDAALNGRLTPVQAWAQFRLEVPLTNAELAVIASNTAPYLK